MVRRILKTVLGILATLALLVACQSVRNSGGPELRDRPEGALRIATWNVHYIVVGDPYGRWGLAGWETRKGPMSRTLDAVDADVIAFQEMETFRGGNDDTDNLARGFLLSEHSGYRAAAIGDWRSFPSTQPIFYRHDRMEVLDQGWFFFSETPDVIYSRTFDGSYPAFASWARFQVRDTGATFRVVNVHTDYASRENRTRSVELVASRTAAWIAAGESVFLAGDLNARLGSDLHDMLETAGLTFVPVHGATYHLDRGLNLFAAIDHIGFAGEMEAVGEPVVYREKLGEVWPTDHYPLLADFLLE